ncbi:MAG TPA: hypothetical protein PK733_17285 [Clostridiales bacterium]|nr:hypothetical protein [Clostridiales bacterium]
MPGIIYIARIYAGIDNLKASIVLEKATEKGKHIQEQYHKDNNLGSIVKIFSENGYFEIITLFKIADKYIELLEKDKAAGVLAKSLEVIELINEKRTRASYLADIDVKYIQAGIKPGVLKKEMQYKILN